MIKFELSVEEVNLIVAGLRKLPVEAVESFLKKFVEEAQKQLQSPKPTE